ncbi:MAG TPA: Nramp family divalent metal transporter [Terriglobia bacterium]|nr:Nramp family divalent metal transporter [Terriglobia bacterium]
MSSPAKVRVGATAMPAWDVGELPEAPAWRLRNWAMMIGPGLMCAGAAIGGGEWLMGPVNTGRYGGAVLWVCTLSIAAQVIYNIEISRYTLYTGEPIMNGKFRTFLGPMFWLGIYALLDLGSLMPYQASSTAVPVYTIVNGSPPDPVTSKAVLLFIMCAIYVGAALPLVFSGKIYNFVKHVMTVKVVVVFGVLVFLALTYSTRETWMDIITGFFRFGTVPVKSGGVENIVTNFFAGRSFPDMDETSFAALAAFAAIAGIGGLKNTMISSYTRDQGWGMGKHVGAISGMMSRANLQVSHVGMVFRPDATSMPRWRRWMKHLVREQVVIWGVGAMIGVGLPAVLSVQFIPRGTTGDAWAMAIATAENVRLTVAGSLGVVYWYVLVFCGILVLVPNTITDADSTVRRWVDLAWSGSKKLRVWAPRQISLFYFWVLAAYVALGVVILLSGIRPRGLVEIYSCIANFALGYSCFHVLGLNLTLLPAPIRPGWWNRILLSLAGLYFLALAAVTVYFEIRKGNVLLGWVASAIMAVFLAVLAVYGFKARADRTPAADAGQF